MKFLSGDMFHFCHTKTFALVKFDVFWLLVFAHKAVKPCGSLRLSGASRSRQVATGLLGRFDGKPKQSGGMA